jgi:hypothetical protein
LTIPNSSATRAGPTVYQRLTRSSFDFGRNVDSHVRLMNGEQSAKSIPAADLLVPAQGFIQFSRRLESIDHGN